MLSPWRTATNNVSRWSFALRRGGNSFVLRNASALSVVKPPEERPKLVILGTGWAAVNLIRNLDERCLKQYSILVCSPVNHFVNTPLLPSVTVGTVEPRSVAEPIRSMIVKHRRRVPDAFIKFNEVEATQVDTKEKRIMVTTRATEGRASFRSVIAGMKSAVIETSYWINYDVLVCAVGATTNTFGTPGALEHCTFLKTVQDAVKIRTTLLDCFETAAVFATPDGPFDSKEIDRLLTFVIIGAGPTGVEIAAELRDFVKEDVIESYSAFKSREIKIMIVEMGSAMLGTYDKIIQDYCSSRFKKNDIEMLTRHQVKRVNEKSVEALCLETGETKVIPFGMCVWASGVRPNTVSLDMAKELQGTRMLEVDRNLRAFGSGGSIFALGDCAKIVPPKLKENAAALFKKADKNGDGVLQKGEFEQMMFEARKEYPQIEAFIAEVSKESVARMFTTYDDKSPSAGVPFEVFMQVCEDVDKAMKLLPPTAQVAAQQGEYLAKLLNSVPCEELGFEDGFEPGFEYKHAGSMAYVGGEHAVISSPLFGVSTGIFTYVMWKGVYWSKAVSLRNKLQLCFDWAKSWFLGRDTSRL